MEDLLQSQIKDSCRLALPEGLRDLMSDISREVLRAQPTDIYKFIADYLSALLLARDSLTIAGQICRDVCDCSCRPELEEELRQIGMEENELEIVMGIVLKYFDKDSAVIECNLFMELFKSTIIDEESLQAVQEAVRRSFLRHQMNHPKRYKMPTSNEGSEGAAHTLRMYESFDDMENKMATKIQALVRGYLVRKKQINPSHLHSKKRKRRKQTKDLTKTSICTVSSQSLAGSYLNLPRHVPYSAHCMSYDQNEDYNSLDHSDDSHEPSIREAGEGKKIGFHENFTLYEISHSKTRVSKGSYISEHNTDASEESVEENILKDYSSEEDNSAIKEDLGANHDIIIRVSDMSDELDQKASSSRDLFNQTNHSYLGTVEEDNSNVKGDLECNSKVTSRNELDVGERTDVGLTDLISAIFNLEEQKTEEVGVIKKNEDASTESITTLNSVNRDRSVLIKPVEEFIDLKVSLQKVIEKHNDGES